MAIWVSKDASRHQECRQMSLNNLWISLIAQNVKILTFKIFLCIFWNFLCIMWGARGRSSTPPRELKFFVEFYMTMFNGKISLANSESNFGFFWPPLIRTYLDLSWNMLTYVDLAWHISTNRRASQPMHGVYLDYSRFETIWCRGGIKI